MPTKAVWTLRIPIWLEVLGDETIVAVAYRREVFIAQEPIRCLE
jgi:hypothetical protein